MQIKTHSTPSLTLFCHKAIFVANLRTSWRTISRPRNGVGVQKMTNIRYVSASQHPINRETEYSNVLGGQWSERSFRVSPEIDPFWEVQASLIEGTPKRFSSFCHTFQYLFLVFTKIEARLGGQKKKGKNISSKVGTTIINVMHGFGAWHRDPSVTLVTTDVAGSQRQPTNPSTLFPAWPIDLHSADRTTF